MNSNEIRALKQIFLTFDKNEDDLLSKKEFYLLAKKLGEYFTKKELEVVIDQLDVDGDNKISFSEFLSFFTE